MTATDAAALAGRTAAALPSTKTARWGAWLLSVSPAYFALILVTNVGTFATAGIGQFADITREQMDAISAGWVLASTLFPLAYILGATGVVLLASTLTRRGRAGAICAWGAIIAGVAAILLYLPYMPFRVVAMGFTEERLGDNVWYAFWEPMGYAGSHTASAALVLLCGAVLASSRHRVAALVIGGLALVYLVVGLVGLVAPPPVLALLWCALGVVWLRSVKRDRAAVE